MIGLIFLSKDWNIIPVKNICLITGIKEIASAYSVSDDKSSKKLFWGLLAKSSWSTKPVKLMPKFNIGKLSNNVPPDITPTTR